MHCRKAFLTLLLCALPVLAGGAAFEGKTAFQYTGRLVALGPRPSGSPALAKARAWILEQLRHLRCEVSEDRFQAKTPNGPVAMANLIARFPGTSGKAIAVTGHYDTKRLPGRFVGANDGGSSAGFLLELANAVNGKPRKDDLYLVWLDGEEAVHNWTDTDSLYGSRHLAQKWSEQGVLAGMKALINIDMIGDRDLGILREEYSSPSLVQLFWSTARNLGYGSHFLDFGGAVQDDHFPFAAKGVSVIDLIDFDYGPANAWWHTDQDTMDKLSPQSFQIVGDVVLKVIERLQSGG